MAGASASLDAKLEKLANTEFEPGVFWRTERKKKFCELSRNVGNRAVAVLYTCTVQTVRIGPYSSSLCLYDWHEPGRPAAACEMTSVRPKLLMDFEVRCA